jgi:hypothetical protein
LFQRLKLPFWQPRGLNTECDGTAAHHSKVLPAMQDPLG